MEVMGQECLEETRVEDHGVDRKGWLPWISTGYVPTP